MSLTASEKEREFVVSYSIKIKELQKKLSDSEVVYTTLTPAYAIINSLCSINIVFHPMCIAIHKTYEKPDLTDKRIKKVILDIILYELMSPISKTKLTSEELSLLITHFRSIESR